MVLPRRRLTGFRVKPIYSPDVMSQLERPWDDERGRARLWSSKEEAEQVAAIWRSEVADDR